MSDIDLGAVNRAPRLELPFKPFTLDEVRDITGCTARALDGWTRDLLKLHHGSGAVGLNDVQCFAVYCAWRFLEEGAPPLRAVSVLRMLAQCSLDHIQSEAAQGRTCPVPAGLARDIPEPGVFVEPPDSALGRRLSTPTLLAGWRAALARVFPGG